MPIIEVLLVIALVGFLVYAQDRWIPMSPGWHKCIRVVAVIAVAIWLINMFVPLSGLMNVRLGRH